MGYGFTVECLKIIPDPVCMYATADGTNFDGACGAWILQNNLKFPKDYPW